MVIKRGKRIKKKKKKTLCTENPLMNTTAIHWQSDPVIELALASKAPQSPLALCSLLPCYILKIERAQNHKHLAP